MRTTLNIEDALINKASELTGIKEKTYLVKLGLEALIEKESARRLAKLGRSEPQLNNVIRKRLENPKSSYGKRAWLYRHKSFRLYFTHRCASMVL